MSEGGVWRWRGHGMPPSMPLQCGSFYTTKEKGGLGSCGSLWSRVVNKVAIGVFRESDQTPEAASHPPSTTSTTVTRQAQPVGSSLSSA